MTTEPTNELTPSGSLMDSVKDILNGAESKPTNEADQGEPRVDNKATAAPDGDNEASSDAGNNDTIELSDDGIGLLSLKSEALASDEGQGALAQLAEKAGLSMEALYKTPVPLGGELGEKTLGELKDIAKTQNEFAEVRQAFDDEKMQHENEVIRSRQELNEIIQLLPQVPEALVQKARANFGTMVENERQALFTIKPEWRDEENFARAKEQIMSSASEYGFNKADLEGVFDHRLIKLLHDFSVLRGRFAEANAARKRQVAEHAKQTRTRGNNAQRGNKPNKQQPTTKGDTLKGAEKLSAVKNILIEGTSR